MATNTATDTAGLILAAMGAADRSKKWTAEKSGIPVSTFLRKVRGFGDFTIREVANVAQALGVHPSDLLPAEFSRVESQDAA